MPSQPQRRRPLPAGAGMAPPSQIHNRDLAEALIRSMQQEIERQARLIDSLQATLNNMQDSMARQQPINIRVLDSKREIVDGKLRLYARDLRLPAGTESSSAYPLDALDLPVSQTVKVTDGGSGGGNGDGSVPQWQFVWQEGS